MIKEPTPIEIDNCGHLNCPECGGNNIHHKGVSVYLRDREDGPGVLHLVPEHSVDKVDSFQIKSHQIPGRRNSLLINFWCETCPEISTLQIIQHKGNTQLNWIREIGLI